ncbi:MAG: hypothetical protein ACJ8KX_00285 [Chthoniobacterales bacterium]
MAAEPKVRRRVARRSEAARAIILLDQNSFRRSVAEECSALRLRLSEARAAWHRFEREDKQSFVRWRARAFGSLLSELRDIEAQIREHETLVHEVEMEMRRGFYDPHTAYNRVMVRRGNPTAPPPEPAPQRTSGSEQVVSEFEQEALFHDWVHKFMGTHPDKLDDETYEASFEAFKTHMFRSRPKEQPRVSKVAEFVRQNAPRPEEEAAPVPVDARVKEVYRLLVRRLHPDSRVDGNAAASALWHEVQEAYAANDVAQLEILLALSDIEADPFNDETTLAQMRAVARELERALFALEDSLRQASNDDAWNFARTGPDDHLQTSVERDLTGTLRMRSDRLALLQQTLASWSRPTLVRQASFR